MYVSTVMELDRSSCHGADAADAPPAAEVGVTREAAARVA